MLSESSEPAESSELRLSLFIQKLIKMPFMFKWPMKLASQRAYILEEMAVQLKKKAEERFSHDEYKVGRIKLTAGEKVDSEEDIKTISVYMAPSSEKTVQTVAPVHIDTDHAYVTKEAAEQKEAKQIQTQLADIWEIGSEKITVHMEGGESVGNE